MEKRRTEEEQCVHECREGLGNPDSESLPSPFVRFFFLHFGCEDFCPWKKKKDAPSSYTCKSDWMGHVTSLQEYTLNWMLSPCSCVVFFLVKSDSIFFLHNSQLIINHEDLPLCRPRHWQECLRDWHQEGVQKEGIGMAPWYILHILLLDRSFHFALVLHTHARSKTNVWTVKI